MFHILASGSILIQKWYPEIERFGYIDKVNCILFKTKEELKAKLDWLQLQKQSYYELLICNQHKLAQKHTYLQRAYQLAAFLLEGK